MDAWQIAQNYGIFGVLLVGTAYYYWPSQKPAPARRGSKAQQNKKEAAAERLDELAEAVKPTNKSTKSSKADKPSGSKNNGSKQAKQPKPQKQQAATPEIAVEDVAHDDEAEMSAKAFAERMRKAKEGTDLSRPAKDSQQRIKTVKTGNARASPLASSGASQDGADADGELSPIQSPSLRAGDVSDMLEPVASGPTSLRITASEGPMKQKKQVAKKEEKPETKKQRQNRQKKEEARLVREEQERERKVLMDNTRRSAREARGEPAKNGVPVAPAPTSNPWSAQNAATEAKVQTAPVVNGGPAPPLLDTFDVESTGSSNGVASTAATSTYEQDMASEEDQMAAAVKQSEDESGWATVSKPKKQKKRVDNAEDSGAMTPVEAPKAKPVKPAPAPTSGSSAKPKGYMALQDEYVQRTDVDANDASNWDA